METDGPFILPIRSCTFWTLSSSSLATEIVWHVTHWLPPLLCLQMFLRDCWHSTWPPLHSRGAPAPQPSKQMSHHHPHLLTLTNHPALQVGSSLSSPTDTLPVICMYLYSYRSGATREDINRQVNAINFGVVPEPIEEPLLTSTNYIHNIMYSIKATSLIGLHLEFCGHDLSDASGYP